MKEGKTFRRPGLMAMALFLLLCSSCETASDTSSPNFLDVEAHKAFVQGDLVGARELDLRGLSLSPENADLMNNLAVVQSRLGHEKAALKLLEKAHRIAPGNSEILLNLARVELKNGHEEEALRVARILVEQEEWPVGFRTLMGKIEIDFHHDREAHIYLHEAHDRHPNNPLVLTYLGIVHDRLGMAKEAKKNFEEALARNPSPRLRRAVTALLHHLGAGHKARQKSQNPPLTP